LAGYTIHAQIAPRYAGRVKPTLLRAAAAACLRHQLVAPPAELTIAVAGDALLRRLNRDFLGIDAPTDVLSFGVRSEELGVGSGESRVGKSKPKGNSCLFLTPHSQLRGLEAYLGDIALSFPRARAQARAAGHSVEAELQLLVVHGVLHLLGHDHARRRDQAAMWEAQDAVLNELRQDR
jgi:probable rRNA maturation factor